MYVKPRQHVDGAASPFPRVHVSIGFGDSACGGEQEGERKIGSSIGVNAGSVGDQNAPFCGRRDVDVVEADTDASDYANTFELRENVGAEPIGEVTDDSLFSSGTKNELGGREALVGGDIVDVGVLVEEIDGFFVDALSNEYGEHGITFRNG